VTSFSEMVGDAPQPRANGDAKSNGGGAAAGRLIQTSAEFIEDFVPPDYLVDGVLQKSFLYAMTAPTGAGKTSIAMRIAMHVALGLPIGGLGVVKGRVLFFVGENPDDARMRCIKLFEEMQVDAKDVDVFWRPGGFQMSDAELRGRIDTEMAAHGPLALVVVDTSAAFFEGDNENDNKQMIDHARMFRSLVSMPGAPAVLVTCHPIKNPNMDNLLPRGGGAFLAEVDGNLVCVKSPDSMDVEVSWHGKFRGPDFAPIPFRLTAGTSDKLVDSKARHITTVTASPITARQQEAASEVARGRENDLMDAMRADPNGSLRTLTDRLGWKTGRSEPNVSLVRRTMAALKADGLVAKSRGAWILTKTGKNAAAKAGQNAAPAKQGELSLSVNGSGRGQGEESPF